MPSDCGDGSLPSWKVYTKRETNTKVIIEINVYTHKHIITENLKDR